jgi:hypothetical protein
MAAETSGPEPGPWRLDMSLHEYDGAAVHAGKRGRRHVTRQCCSDHSGLIEYAFNSHGYRGAEFDPQAEVAVFAVGCSHAFGVGVAAEQTWPSVFCRGFAGHYGLSTGRLNLQNFSQGAASNDYIARVILTQCARVEPALVLGAFTHDDRSEYLADRGACNIGPWRVKDPEDQIGSPTAEIADAFYDYYSDELGNINAIKNILLTQEFLKSRQIPYLFSWIGGGLSGRPGGVSHPVIGRMLELVDRAHLCPGSIVDDDIFVDRAADRAHPGPQSHARFAGRLLATCRALYPPGHFRRETIIARRRAASARPSVPSPCRPGGEHHGIAPSPPPAGPRGDATGQDAAAPQSRRSRWQRLRDKIGALKKKDPNIYPLY